MSQVVLRVLRLRPDRDGDLPLPARATAAAAGFDLVAAESLLLDPGAFGTVGTGLAMAVPSGFEVQIRPRSGLAARHGVTVLNSPGTVDADYRGEVRVILINHGAAPYRVERGARIAQAIVAALAPVTVQSVSELDDTARGEGGFGSTGVGPR